jgi:hypothetical protein
MRKFIKRMFIFFIPFPIYIGLVVLIDPFNYFDISHVISNNTKINTSERLHPQLWKLIEYKRMRTAKIILGDSRSAKVNTADLKSSIGSDIYNFSYTGGTLIDIIETFWYATTKQKLEEVYIGINFNLYNDFERNNNVEQARSIMKNFFSYSFNKVVISSLIQNIKREYFIKDFIVGTPDMDRNKFWSYQIDVMGKRFYQKYKYPEQYHQDLVNISNYCKKNNIKLTLFMPPTHVELQKRISDFKLEDEYNTFVQDISKLGSYYNFDVISDYTKNKQNFYDPFHPVNDSLIVHSIWITN